MSVSKSTLNEVLHMGWKLGVLVHVEITWTIQVERDVSFLLMI